METKYFKKNHYEYIALYAVIDRCTLWACKHPLCPYENSPPMYYLGRIECGKLTLSEYLRTYPYGMERNAKRLYDLVAQDKTIAYRSTSCYYGDMNPEIQAERNKLIVTLKDEKGMSFAEIARFLKLKAKSTVHHSYNLAKGKKRVRKSYPQKKLGRRSTV